jgi:delta14-sterol reductase
MMPFSPATPLSVALAALGIACFVALLFLGSLLVPGRVREGRPQSDGRAVQYRLNGLALFVLCLAGVAVFQLAGPGLAALARHFWSLIIAANLLAWPAALVLFLAGRPDRSRRLRDFFIGIERNPSLFGVDLKMFSYRPSLIGLALINLAFAALQWQQAGRLTLAMTLYQLFTLLYVANYFHFERGMLFTWDIIEERFGWNLIWGDFVLVPFFYGLPAIYVFLRPNPLPIAAVPLLLAVYGFGFWLFRGANEQKHRFRETPDRPIWGRAPRAIGGRLLISGFWGIGRKLNYTGELLMYLSWTFLSGFHSAVPYLVPIWLFCLLAQRAERDDRRCRAKYGALWGEYCRQARFRMFPYIY